MSTQLSPRRPKRKRIAEINVVPYIDVMLVLLVIFMITAPLLAEGVKVQLPETSSSPIQQDQAEPIIVTVDRKGRYYLNISDKPDERVKKKLLVERIAAVKRQRKNAVVLVRGDSNAKYGDVVKVMALLQKAGVQDVGLITKIPGTNR